MKCCVCGGEIGAVVSHMIVGGKVSERHGYDADCIAHLKAERDRLADAVRKIDARWGHYANTPIPEESEGTSFAAVVQIVTGLRKALKVTEAAKGGGA